MKARRFTRREFLKRASALSGAAVLGVTLGACGVQVTPTGSSPTKPVASDTVTVLTKPVASEVTTATVVTTAEKPTAASPSGEPSMWKTAIPEPTKPVTITHWRATDPDFEKLVGQMTADFSKQHPNIKIEYNTFPTEEYTAKLGLATAGGEAPTIAEFDGVYLAQYATQGLAISMDDYVNPAYCEDLVLAARGSAEYNNKWWAFPNEATVMGFMVNTGLLETAGFKAPQTQAEFLEAAKKLKLTDAKGNVTQWGFMRPSGTDGWVMHNTWSWLWAYNASFLSPDGTEPAITKPNAIEAIKAIVSIYKNGIAPLSSTDISSFSFQAGNVAMSQDGNWAVGDLAKNYPDVKYMAQELPIPDGGDPVNCVFGGWQPCFTPTFAQSDEDTKRGALLWMEYFGSSKAMTLLYTDYGVFPTRKSTLEQIPNTNMSPQVAQFKNLMATKTRARETNVRYTDITTAFLEEMQNAIYKDVPVETAMKSADERLRSIMSKKS